MLGPLQACCEVQLISRADEIKRMQAQMKPTGVPLIDPAAPVAESVKQQYKMPKKSRKASTMSAFTKTHLEFKILNLQAENVNERLMELSVMISRPAQVPLQHTMR